MNDIIKILKQEIPESQINLKGDGSRLELMITSPFFKGVSRLERQRIVKRLLKPWIDSGVVHAVMLTVKDGEEL